MTINYNELLTLEQKRAIVEQRITNFAAEAYQHSLNKIANENMQETEMADAAEKSIKILEEAIAVYQAELKQLSETD
jgi:fructose-1,6-bisphosphatase